jgi:DNA polymerase-3 subunit gamma/tau
MINRILTKEKVSLPYEVLDLIAQHGESSFRDSTKILEEFIMQKITTVEGAEKYLGIRGKNNILELIEKSELQNSLSWINEFGESGGNFKSLIEDLLERLRIVLLSKKGLKLDDVEDSSLSISETMLLIKLLMEAYKNLKISPIESLPLEIAIVEFYNQRVNKK